MVSCVEGRKLEAEEWVWKMMEENRAETVYALHSSYTRRKALSSEVVEMKRT